jgi:two-component system chemotaxis response regulator CheB
VRELRVLVVDDSAFNRKQISEILEGIDGVRVVGKAAHGEEALRMLGVLDVDLITLDLEMPKMDGFAFLRLAMARKPIPVVVVSTHDAKPNLFRALELGALDFVAKGGTAPGDSLRELEQQLRAKVEMVRRLEPTRLVRGARGTVSAILRRPRKPLQRVESPLRNVVLIAASTGGPSALVDLIGTLKPELPAAFIVLQHMPARFTRTFAQRLDRLPGFEVREARDGDLLQVGQVLVAPGGRCLEVTGNPSRPRVALLPATSEDRYVPSANRAMRTAAETLGPRATGVVLTGMGDDGARGIEAIQAAGGRTLVQSPEDAVLDGMPLAALRTGVVDETLPLRMLGRAIERAVGHPSA